MSELLNWPPEFHPDRAPVFAHNEIVTARPAPDLWPALIRAAEWPEWYAHASDVRGIGPGEDLFLGATFSWKTLGVRVTTTVTELVPHRALAWRGTARGSRGYHRWVLHPTADGGCRIVTEEVQVGPIPTMLAARLRKNLAVYHQEWLEGLVAHGEA
ncbi:MULTISPECIES: SRPBCC family protein [unclassified Microbacterium]|uniref:SRPBCC family protein n=1 Tax=unclassified Microbacterium TaxID=2609290 RepID=UPI00140248C7|nr:SRPBCC family protein [Microbacterium sp. Gd 4-13]